MKKPLCQLCLVTLAVLASACRHQDATTPDEATRPGSSGIVGARAALGHSQITSGGHVRTFEFYAPPTRADAGLLPLLIALHGRMGTGAQQDKLTHFSGIAEREGFLVAFPDGYRRSWHDLRETGPAAAAGYDDVQFLSDLIAHFTREYKADPSRVYLTGMSNGGFMSFTFACKAASQVAAIAEVVSTGPDDIAAKCTPARPVSVMMVNGTADPLVPYAGGNVANDESGDHGRAASAADALKLWVAADGCGTSTTSALPDTDPNDGTHTTIERFQNCKEGTEVALYSVVGGGHGWPGGPQYFPERMIGKVSHDFDASEQIWAFFKDKHR